MAAQLIHVVRHAHAGDPNAWMLDDDLRPLSERGIGQAESLAERLGLPRPQALYSSPSLRCVATIVPLARRARLPLSTLAELYEGGTATAMLARLGSDGLSPLVVCTHGDVVLDLLGLLAAAGLIAPTPRAEKGSTWTVELVDGRLSSARYEAAP
jgi:broad specificity phosphatase PhoE